MAKSRRDRVVSLTKVKKKTKETKQKLIESIRSATQNFRYCYVLSIQNQRNSYLKTVRNLLAPARIFYGKNKVMQIALGMCPENEVATNAHKIAKMLSGERCLLFSNANKNEILKFCDETKFDEFAKAGFVPDVQIVLQEGTESMSKFSHSLEPHLRNLGLHTRLIDTKIHLLQDFDVCTEGVPITAEQAQLLKHLDIRLAKFSIQVEAVLSCKSGEFTEIYTNRKMKKKNKNNKNQNNKRKDEVQDNSSDGGNEVSQENDEEEEESEEEDEGKE